MGSPHLHNFRVVNRSQSHYGTGMRWIERCRCSCTIQCDNSFEFGSSKAKTVKHWFDREGNLLRITGEKVNRATGEIEGYTSQMGKNGNYHSSGDSDSLTRKMSIENTNSQSPIDQSGSRDPNSTV